MVSRVGVGFGTIRRGKFLFGKASSEVPRLNDENERGEEDLLRETIFALAEKLSGEELRLTDYLRLAALRDETDEGRRVFQLKAGWVRRWQGEDRSTDG